MKKWLSLIAVAAVAGTSFGASLKEGTRELVVEGGLDPEAADGTAVALGVKYGVFIQDSVEVGVSGAYADSDDSTVYGAGVFGELNFDSGSSTVPFVGVDASYLNSDIGGVEDDAVEVTGSAGVKLFVAENVAISVQANYHWASEDIYVNDGDVEDTDIDVTVGMRFFLP